MPVLSNIHPEFEGMGISAIDDTSHILTGRPYGGVAILIRKLLRPVCEFVFYDDTRMIDLEVKHLKERLYFINVYLRYQCPDNYDLYAEYLGKISAIVEDCHSTHIAIIGDFNAASGTTFEDELLEYFDIIIIIQHLFDALFTNKHALMRYLKLHINYCILSWGSGSATKNIFYKQKSVSRRAHKSTGPGRNHRT